MRHLTVVLGSILLLAGSLAHAGTSPTEERVGVGIGVTVGAVAGGPVGALIGAAIGAKLGDNYHRKTVEIDSLTASLDRKTLRVDELEGAVAGLNRDLSALESDLRRMQAQARPELVSLLAAGIEMDLLFRTDEHVLTAQTDSRISQLATTLASMPDIRIRLDGFADERGDASYNHDLSLKRAQHVRETLVRHGVPAERISVTAHGEAAAEDPGSDSLALQRKVSLTLFIDEAPSVAANPK